MDQLFVPIPLRHTVPRSKKAWMDVKQRHLPHAVQASSKMKAPGAHVLAGFGARKGVGKLLFCAPYTKLTGERVKEIYTRSLVPSLKRFYPGVSKFSVQQDGDKSLNATVVRTAMRDRGVTFWQRGGGRQLEPPANSGDLWPMETAWADARLRLKKKVWASKRWCKGVRGKPGTQGKHATQAELRAWVSFVVSTIKAAKPSFLARLAKGMPARIAQCIARKGAAIDK